MHDSCVSNANPCCKIHIDRLHNDHHVHPGWHISHDHHNDNDPRKKTFLCSRSQLEVTRVKKMIIMVILFVMFVMIIMIIMVISFFMIIMMIKII